MRWSVLLAIVFCTMRSNAQSWVDAGITNGFIIVNDLVSPVNEASLYLLGAAFSPPGKLVHWDGSLWTVDAAFPAGDLWTMAEDGDTLYVGGYFDQVDSVLCSNLVQFVNGVWYPTTTFGGGGGVTSVKVYGDTVLAVGSFSELDGEPCMGMAMAVNGVWECLADSGMIPTLIYDVIKHHDTLFVAGTMEVPPGPGRGIIYKTTGPWQQLGAGFLGMNGIGKSLAVYHDHLYIGGSIYSYEGNVANGIARWNGTSLEAVGQPTLYGVCGTLNCPCDVYDMVVHDDKLFVSGRFGYANGTPVTGVAYWDDVSWCPLGGGLQMPVRAIGFFQDTLFASTAQLDGVQIFGVAKYVADTAFAPCWSTEVNEPLGLPHLQLSPVPCSDRLSVTGIPSGARELVVLDALGRIVLRVPASSALQVVDVRSLLPGCYMMQFLGLQSASTVRFLKE
jgi:hypothetical protein